MLHIIIVIYLFPLYTEIERIPVWKRFGVYEFFNGLLHCHE